jgi:hypothetical protein
MPKKRDLARRRYIRPKALIQACSMSASRAILGHVLRRVARALRTLSVPNNAHLEGSKTWTPFGKDATEGRHKIGDEVRRVPRTKPPTKQEWLEELRAN